MEYRVLTRPPAPLELRAAADGARRIVGYAAVFNEASENLGGFVELIRPGAFKRFLNSKGADVVALLNHDPSHVLGRRSAGTLEVAEDEHGLRFEVEVNRADPGAVGVAAAVERRDIQHGSFSFDIGRDDWKQTESGYPLRVLEEIKRLWDVSPVTWPAYPATQVDARAAVAGLAETRSLPADQLAAALTAGRLFDFLADPRPEPPAGLLIARKRLEMFENSG